MINLATKRGAFSEFFTDTRIEITSFRLGLIGRRSVASVVVIAGLICRGLALPLRQYEKAARQAAKQQEPSKLEELRAELQTKLIVPKTKRDRTNR